MLEPLRPRRRRAAGAQAPVLVLARPARLGRVPRRGDPPARRRRRAAADRRVLRPADRPRRRPARHAAREPRPACGQLRRQHEFGRRPRRPLAAGPRRAAPARHTPPSSAPCRSRSSCSIRRTASAYVNLAAEQFLGMSAALAGAAPADRPGAAGQPAVPADRAGAADRGDDRQSRPDAGKPAAAQARHHRAGLAAAGGAGRGRCWCCRTPRPPARSTASLRSAARRAACPAWRRSWRMR